LVGQAGRVPLGLVQAYLTVYIYVLMRRTTIFIEEGLLKQARRYAAREGKSFAQVVREALTAYLTGGVVMNRKLPRLAGSFASGRTDTSEKVDELLWNDPHA